MISGFILTGPDGLTKVIHVTMELPRRDQAGSTIATAVSKKSQGLALKCTAKEKKGGYGGKMMKVFVAIAHGHGAVLCEQYEKQLTGQLQGTF